ncbi:MAG: SDR family NAD(P)-dependent oxidoreductase, partial [Opitutus sp.]
MSTTSPPHRPSALVTGASRSLGRAIAQQLARRGCRVAVHFAQNQDAAEKTLRSLPGDGHILARADVSKAGDIQHLWDDVVHAFGRIDVLVNNAGIYREHPPLSTDFDSWRKQWAETLATNLIGPAHLCHLAANHMAQAGDSIDTHHGRGRIV